MPKPTPTKDQIEKLPKWAQDHINHLEIERSQAIKALRAQTDRQTPSNIFFDEYICIGEDIKTGEKIGGPTNVRHYIQTNRIQLKLPRAEMELEVYLNEPEQRVELRTPRGYPYIEAQAANQYYLVPKEDIYLTPNAVTLLQAAYEARRLDFDTFVKKFGFSPEALDGKIRDVVPKSHWNRTVGG